MPLPHMTRLHNPLFPTGHQSRNPRLRAPGGIGSRTSCLGSLGREVPTKAGEGFRYLSSIYKRAGAKPRAGQKPRPSGLHQRHRESQVNKDPNQQRTQSPNPKPRTQQNGRGPRPNRIEEHPRGGAAGAHKGGTV